MDGQNLVTAGRSAPPRQPSTRMKLTNTQNAATTESPGATPVPEYHPVMAQLRDAFGEHTFFLDHEGLSVFVDEDEVEDGFDLPEGEPRLVMIAAWTDDGRSSLGPVEPVDRGITLPESPQGTA